MKKTTILVAASALLGLAGCSSGSRCSVTDNADGTATLRCEDGTSFVVRNGGDGTDGTDGTDGMDGASCTVTDLGMGMRRITCEDGTMVTVNDGTTGTDGRNAFLTGPGLTMAVRAQGIDADRHPFIELRFTDADDRPLDRTGLYTEGAIAASFTVAHLPTTTTVAGDTVILPYQSYLTRDVTSADMARTGTQPIADTGGTWTDVDAEDGVYRYTFGATLPLDYVTTETHMIGVWATRTFDGTRFVANTSPTFRPDGMAVTQTREIVTNDACNTCHNPLSAHGGAREDVGLCISCHGQGYTDPDSGNAIGFETMIHRIHRGRSLRSVESGIPYQIVGFRGEVHDYSEVGFPQDIRNCTTCHAGADADLPLTQPSSASCGSCHDDIHFAAGSPPMAWMRPHPGGARTDDTCAACHGGAGSVSPILDTHRFKDDLPIAQIPELTVDALTLTAGRNIQIDFTARVNGTPRDVLTSPLTSLSTIVAGPTTDYLFNTSFTLTNASQGTLSARNAAMGQFRWVSAQTVDTIAANANAEPQRNVPGVTITPTGTWGVGLQGTLRVSGTATGVACTAASDCNTAAGAAPEGASWGCVTNRCVPQYTYPAYNPVSYLAITDPTPVPRRTRVDASTCNGCHVRLELHGGGRNDPEYCVMCHNATFDTIDRMPVPLGSRTRTQGASLAYMVHRIHTGEDGVSPATWWSPRSGAITNGGTPADFSELRFPADRRDCSVCHVSSIDLDAMSDLRPTRTRDVTVTALTDTFRTTLSTVWTPAISSACTGCHDTPAAAAHAETMTTSSGAESCAACHAAGAEYGIDTVHARPEYDLR
jgi:OmcA/MtrC family decaheme c-type cytochrome